MGKMHILPDYDDSIDLRKAFWSALERQGENFLHKKFNVLCHLPVSDIVLHLTSIKCIADTYNLGMK